MSFASLHSNSCLLRDKAGGVGKGRENQLISSSTQESQYLKTTPTSDLIQNKQRPASLGTDWIGNERFGLVFVKTIIFVSKTGSINSGTGQIQYEKKPQYLKSMWETKKGTNLRTALYQHFPEQNMLRFRNETQSNPPTRVVKKLGICWEVDQIQYTKNFKAPILEIAVTNKKRYKFTHMQKNIVSGSVSTHFWTKHD
jgi:hypothetical protein